MAETVHLYLKANGQDIKGESTQESLGRKDSIECYGVSVKANTAREPGTGIASGRRQYEPLTFKKRLDRSSPLLAKAMVENQKIDGEFKFFRPNPNGDGTTQHFYTLTVKNGRLSSMRQWSPESFSPGESNEPVLEEFAVVFGSIGWTFVDGGISHEDSWSQNR